MKILLTFLVFQGIFTLASASNDQNIRCTPKLISTQTDSEGILKVCQEEAQEQKYFQLSRWLEQTVRFCKIEAPYKNDPQYYTHCLEGTLALANEVLTCEQSPTRFKEIVAYDKLLVEKRLEEDRPISTPTQIQKLFDHLTLTTSKNFNFDFQLPTWKLITYQGRSRNASAGADGTVLLSNSFWQGENPFTENEVAAILAHEISHVLLRHFHKMGCLSLGWMSSNMSLQEAIETMEEDSGLIKNPAIEKDRAWMNASQNHEFEADKMATVILERAGMDPNLMASALNKLKPKTSGGFSSGSHPDLDERIDRVRRAL